MDEQVLLLKMADRWRIAAREVQNPTLSACYIKRAERYLALADARKRRRSWRARTTHGNSSQEEQ